MLRAAGDVMDLARYCFFECKPARGWAAPLATACVLPGYVFDQCGSGLLPKQFFHPFRLLMGKRVGWLVA